MRYLDKVFHLKAEALQASLPDHSIDLVVADAMYGRGYRYAWGREPKNAHDHWAQLGPIYRDWFRLLKPGGHVVLFQAANVDGEDGFTYGEHFREWFGEYARILLLKRVRRVNWSLDQAIVQTTERKAIPQKETLFWVKYLDTANLGHDTPGNYDDFIPHPCFKPVTGIRRIIEMLTKPGDVVLDPFCGSGTTGVACALTDRRYVLCDRQGSYCRIALERLAHVPFERSPYGSRTEDKETGIVTYYYWHGLQAATVKRNKKRKKQAV